MHCHYLSRENWLSPVIQATWEARTVGWLEVEWLLPPDKSDSVTALGPPCLGKGYRGGLTPMKRRGQAASCINRSHRSSSPSQTQFSIM